jgi:23S rRNA (uracil1939-C5)-methyltransferase
MRRLGGLLSGAAPERIDLAAGDGGAVTSAPVVPGFPHGEVTIEVGGLHFAFDARCFFQAHRGLLGDLVRCVVGERAGGRVFDLYGGVGLFGLACARRGAAVTLVEADRVAARYARINARRNRLRDVDVVNRAVETWIEALPPDADGVIVDPPRAGLAPVVRRALLERPPRRLTYVSCHPAALARDLRELSRVFSFDSLALLDLFPQTGHMEAVAQLSRRDAV